MYVSPPDSDQASPDRVRKSPVYGSMTCKMQGRPYTSGPVILLPGVLHWPARPAGPAPEWAAHLFAVYCAGFRTPTD
jgi:hypothetical protein